jgi:predicted site-specific integrase-resolvase
MPDDLIGSAEACRILDVSRATLTRCVADGRLPLAVKLPGPAGAFLYHRADVLALLREREAVAS